MPSYFIAGIDPGATTGVAIVGLDGKRIASASTFGGMAEAVRIIERHGTPSLIACDVSPAPEAVQKIASYFSCRLYAPSRMIREEEKRQIAGGAERAPGGGSGVVAGAGIGISNNHERDAYAAAIFAYRAVANKMRQIELLDGISHEEKEKIKHLLLKGYKLTDAFAVLSEKQERSAEKEEEKLRQPKRTLSAAELSERLSFLARENSNLKMMLQRLENEKQAMLHRLRLLENGVRERMFRDSEVRSLRFRLKQAMLQIGQMRKKGKTEKWKAGRKEEPPKQPASSDNLYNFEEEIDLEGLVAEYRRGRKS